MTLAMVAALVVRYGLILLFLPFSALDKVLNFSGASGTPSRCSYPGHSRPRF